MKKYLLGALIPLSAAAIAYATTMPNDLYFPKQWGLHNDGTQTVIIDLDDLHTDLQPGVAGTDIGWLDARDEVAQLAIHPVTVAVLDSGIDLKHPDLAGRIAPGGKDFIFGTDLKGDTLGHGTHVSGIIAANADNGTGIAGVTPPSVQILPLRVLSDDFQNFTFRNKLISDYVADAVRYAVAQKASVINLSLGWPKVVDTANARQAFSDAVSAGVVIVVSAGNDRKDEPAYPCAYEGVICVGAISNNGQMTRYSNFNGVVDVLAPGDGILSLYPTAVESQYLRIQGYELLNGTSQASPHVAGIAAVLKSAYPNITSSEIRARILSGAANPPTTGASLYGLANLKRALDVKPSPVYLPEFKGVGEVTLNEADLSVSGTLSIRNLWATANGVSASVTVNGKPAGTAQIDSLAQDQSLALNWKYTFGSLEESSVLPIVITVQDASGTQKTFGTNFYAVRPMDQIAAATPAELVAIPGIKSGDWTSSRAGSLYLTLNPVDTYPTENALPRFFRQVNAAAGTTAVQIFDPAASTAVQTITLPMALTQVTQIIRLDATGNGTRDWVILGYGKDSTGKYYFQFYFLDPNLQPLWGKASAWQVPIDQSTGTMIVQNGTRFRNYAAAGSWVRQNGHLVPAFLSQGLLPKAQNWNPFDPRHNEADFHLYYFSLPTKLPTDAPVPLTFMALDDSTFHDANQGDHLLNQIPQIAADATGGHLRILVSTGTDVNSPTLLWDIPAIGNQTLAPIAGWDLLSSQGLALNAIPGQSVDFLNFFDQARGALTWASPAGKILGRSEFNFTSPSNPIYGLIGAFDLTIPSPSVAGTQNRGRFWFLETGFDLVGSHELPDGTVKTLTVPIERDSSFPGSENSENFTPVLVGTSANPLPGVYVDSTLVQGNRVSVATWNPATDLFEKPLRYSLNIPSGCLQTLPVHLSAAPESYALPLFCVKGDRLTFQAIRPRR